MIRFLFIVLLLFPLVSGAEPIAQSEQGGVKIVLHNDKCALEAVMNLPFRATWTEGGKTTEGCVGLDIQLQLFRFYFADRTVLAIPMQYFGKISAT